jgi:hypothetical protein
MKIKSIILLCGTLLSCSNLNDVEPEVLSAFTHVYGGLGNYRAVSLLATDDGYLLAGDSVGVEDYGIVLIKTDKVGKTIWRKLIQHGTASSLLKTPTGFVLCGDSIKIDLSELSVINQERTKVRLISFNESGIVTNDRSFGDIEVNDQSRTDLKSNAITLLNDQELVITSSVRLPNANPSINTFTQVSSHNVTTFDLNWLKSYNQDNNRNYRNGKSIVINNSGNITWVTSSIIGNLSNGVSFVRIPVLVPDAAPINGDTFGLDDPTNFYGANDIQKSNIGFGIVGTYQTSIGSNSNVFFLQTDPLGNIITGSELFFDGPASDALSNQNQSQVQDQGITLTPTSDGGFLLVGSTTTTTDGTWGNGETDVYLIRINATGQLMWRKFIGGSGDDVPAKVIQTADGGFVIAGTTTLAAQSSMFIIKTNSEGEIKN